ncbi:MAG: amidohydrolase family protein [Pyrinomonadaceae bacterium]|nr:amidohydrolase family protein [Pyrinomonadaceae bacterium]
MLRVPQVHVARPRFPVIDFHTHLTWGPFLDSGESITVLAEAPEILSTMDAKNVRVMVNLTGGFGEGLLDSLRVHTEANPDRFVVFTEPWWSRVAEPNYARFQADEMERAHQAGAAGLKVLKALGLYLRENVTTGPLIKVDDKRFDPMWEAAGALKMPVVIHVSDPRAFFLPIDRFNERYEELQAHPEWSFCRGDFPNNRELQEARREVMARHPRTQFVCAHVADSEDLSYVSECLNSHPNMHVDISARIAELGRQPRTARRFFDKYQDRILFGTDAIPKGLLDIPYQTLSKELYDIYYRFLETEDEYFDYAPAPTPPQGRWRIYGIGLPEDILRKVYWENAARLLGLDRTDFE